MKAIVKNKPMEGLILTDVEMPKMGINDVLIKILKTSICGTDVHIYNWDKWSQKTIKTPLIIGHEFVGEVVDMGANVHDVYIGEIVSGEGHVVCGRCRNCRAGRRHLCNSPSGVGVNRNGAFAEYLSIPVANLWHCNPNIDTELFSCFDPLGNATHAALSFDMIGEDVLITGAGPIGLMAVGIAKKVGARHVVITDINPYRLELAEKMGASAAVNATNESLSDVKKRLGISEGFDIGLEMSGSPTAFKDMISNMAHGGKISMLGILPEASINWEEVIFNGLTLKGIYGREMFETWYKMSMLIEGGLDISPIITHKFHYTDFQKGFDVMRSGNSGKVILDWA